MHFESEYGIFQIPISQLQIHKANGKGEPIYFTDPAQPDLSVYTFDTRVLRLRTLLDAAQTRVQLNAMRRQGEAKRNIKITVGFLVGLRCHRSACNGIGQADGSRARLTAFRQNLSKTWATNFSPNCSRKKRSSRIQICSKTRSGRHPAAGFPPDEPDPVSFSHHGNANGQCIRPARRTRRRHHGPAEIGATPGGTRRSCRSRNCACHSETYVPPDYLRYGSCVCSFNCLWEGKVDWSASLEQVRNC